MFNAEKVIKKKESRLKQRNGERKDIFIADYIKHKHPDAYGEAAQVYQLLKNQYPNKIDLRKTDEHKTWKITDTTILHPAFNIRQTINIPHGAELRIVFPKQNPQPSTIMPPEPSTIMPPEPSTIMPPEPSTIMPPEPSTIMPPEPSTIMSPEPSTNIPPTSEPIIPEPQTNPEPPNPPKPSGKTMYSDNMRLVIPLLKSPVKHPGLITQTTEIVTEETIQGDHQLPDIGQIDPATMEQIINELRADPELKDIFSDVELQVEKDMDLDIDSLDIYMDTRLEDELDNWECW